MFDNHPETKAEAGFAADAQAGAAALQLVDAFVGQFDCDPRLHAKLAIIVEEIILNAVEHGCPAPGSQIEATLRLEPGGVGVTICDCGTHFDPRDAAPVETVPDRGGGAGLALVRAWAVIRDYARADGVNRLDLLIPADV